MLDDAFDEVEHAIRVLVYLDEGRGRQERGRASPAAPVALEADAGGNPRVCTVCGTRLARPNGRAAQLILEDGRRKSVGKCPIPDCPERKA